MELAVNLSIFSQMIWREREREPTRCYTMVYRTYDSLNMFRALLCPSSGAWDFADAFGLSDVAHEQYPSTRTHNL